MAWGLGIAFTRKGDLSRQVAVVGEMSSPIGSMVSTKSKDAPWELLLGNDKLGKTLYLLVPASWDSSLVMLKRGNVSLIIDSRNDSLIYHFDPMNPEAQLTYLQISTALESTATDQNVPDNIEPLTEVGTRYIDFLIPGLVAMGIMMSSMWGISYALIDKRMKKLLRRMVATPMKKSMFLLAQIIARVALSALEATLLVLFAYFYFGISIQRSLWALALIFLAGNMGFSGLAILVSSRTANTQVGNGMINAVVMPMMVMSGIFFSYHNFPEWMIWIIEKLPLTLLANSTRSIFIQGAGIEQVWTAAVALSVFGIFCFSAGLRLYKWY